MFAKIFESDPPRYNMPADVGGIPSGIGLGSLYNPYLVTPPRVYAEALYPVASGFLLGAFVKQERTLYSNFTIHVMSAVDIISWPSYDFRHWWFDGITGTYLGTDNLVASALFSNQIFQMRDGSLWLWFSFGNDIFYELDPLTFQIITSSAIERSLFEGAPILMGYPLIDKAENLIVMKTNNEAIDQLGVYNLTTGALIRRIYISGQVKHIFAEDNKRCYVVSTNYMMNLIDYTTGDVISTLRAPGIEAGAVAHLYAWDRFLRRILVFTQRDDDTDGACLSTFSGYYPVPLTVGMTTPIPLRAARAGRTVPFLCKVYGDAAEPVTGVKITPSVGSSDIIGAPPFTDRDGEAIVSVRADAAGTDTLTITADV